VAVGLWQVRRAKPRWRCGLLLAWLVVVGWGLLGLPAALKQVIWWPTLACLTAAAGWYLTWAVRGTGAATAPASTNKQRSGVVSLLWPLLVCLVPGVGGAAAGPFTVWLVPGLGPDAEDQTVL